MDDFENKLGQILGNPEMMGKAGVDREQKALLAALSPYISGSRIHKLEKAMRAAKLAGVATSFLGSSQLFSGR